jgi:hypothetical protein
LVVVAGLAAAMLAGGVGIYVAQRSSKKPSACATSGEEAFAGAWGPERRAAVQAADPSGSVLGAIVLLDEVRREWLESYAKACAAPQTPEVASRVVCLLAVRDSVARASANLARPGSRPNMTEIGSLAVSVSTCDPDSSPFDAFGRRDRSDDPFPLPPVPPTPPTPPAPSLPPRP